MSAQPDPGAAERPNISIVAGGPPTGAQYQPPTSTEPEAQPPVAPPPPEDLEPDLGGQTLPTPPPERVAEASGGGLAARLNARFQAIAATKEFAVPGWELEDESPGLIVVARAFGDRKAYNKGISNEAFIARSTHQLLFVNDDGTREEVPGGWGPRLAQMVGAPHISKAADLVARVISKPDPTDETKRIPNVAGIGLLATQLVTWSQESRADAEDILGE
jgi:hypothetical protein